jgi:hypothetical protein
MPRPRTPPNPFRYFNMSPEVIRLLVMMYVRFPLSPAKPRTACQEVVGAALRSRLATGYVRRAGFRE